jgi:hypothetical protein
MDPRVSSTGLPVGHANLDLSIHTPDQVDPAALEELIFEHPQVPITLPDDELPVNAAVYRERQPDLRPPFNLIVDAKTSLVSGLARAVWSAKTPFDPGRLRVLGDSRGFERDRTAEVHKEPKNADQAAQALSGLFKSFGLNFLITDNIAGLVEGGLDLRGKGRTVVISAQHEIDLALPAGVGKVSSGGLSEVNTNNPRQLAEENARRATRRQAAVKALKDMGVPEVLVVYDGRNYRQGFDVRSTDRQLAKAVTKLPTMRRSRRIR